MQAYENFPTWRGKPLPLTRAAIEEEIERLIDLLDTVDGDCDLEAVGDERDEDAGHACENTEWPWPEVAA